MLVKLSISGIKARLQDYLVLFSGLVVTAGIFYMFEALASNKAFLESNSTISSVVVIFQIGSVLLGIITFVYLLYANSFLLNMRQKEYGMFMMLGAKVKKIAQLIFIETFLVGVIATALGSALGILLAKVVNALLVSQLDLSIQHFQAFNQKALLITLIFFSALFLLAAIVNATKISQKTILSLLKDASTPAPNPRKMPGLILESIFGVALLAAGYYLMSDLVRFQLIGIVMALITIVLGTYFVFHGLVLLFLQTLKQKDSVIYHGLQNFTLSQLTFRLKDYTKILSLVAMLFALALGALTVGIGFKNDIVKMTKQSTAYDLILNNSQLIEKKQLADLDITKEVVYRQKEDDQGIYYVATDFDKTPLQAPDYSQKNPKGYVSYSGETLMADLTAQDDLRRLETSDQQGKEIHFLNEADFAALGVPEQQLSLIRVKDFEKQLPELKKLVKVNKANNPSITQEQDYQQRATMYQLFNGLYSGFEFMGFFLGIAFLTMLASCLMFKILSGANSDIRRYDMLQKIGTRKKLLKGSLKKEIALLFLAPGILGTIHVLFGLRMFDTLLQNPYASIGVPFGLFGVIYFGYYLLTVKLYERIVLPSKE